MRARILRVTALTAVLMLALIVPASAYIDPGSTTVIFQALIAGLAAAGMGIKIFWSRIIGFFAGSPKSSDRDDTDAGL